MSATATVAPARSETEPEAPPLLLTGLTLLLLAGLVAGLAGLWIALPAAGAIQNPLSPGALRVHLLLAAAAGGAGGAGYALRAFTDDVKDNRFARRQSWSLAVEPFQGALAGLILYAVLRGGLLVLSDAAAPVNAFGLAGAAALGGFESRTLLPSLKEKVIDRVRRPRAPGTPPDASGGS